MPVHRIQLRGPWKLETKSQGAVAFAKKIRLPADWSDLFGGCQGRVCLIRTFHQPTNLGPGDEVDLVFEQWPGRWNVTLNQRPLGQFEDAAAVSPVRMTITALLQPTNVLAVETRFERPIGREAPRGVIGKVALEIRAD